MAELHRIDIETITDSSHAGEWVDIHASRTWGGRLKIQDAAAQGISLWKLAVLEHSIARWSRDEPPEAQAFEALPEELGEALFEEINRWYAERRRSAEDSKSAVAPVAIEAGPSAA